MERASQTLIGKTISGVIARPGSDGREIVVLQFDDGSCFELASERSRRQLRAMARHQRHSAAEAGQLSFFPHDGDSAASVRPQLAA